MNSPPKRRRTGDRSSIAVGASQSLEPPEERRSPTRFSFQSPTRASLARSHPDVLERALSRSPTRRSTSRGAQDSHPENPASTSFGIRGRKALRPSLGPSSPLKAPRLSVGAAEPLSSPSRRASGIQAFSKPPRRMSKRISASAFTFGSPVPTKPIEQDTPEGQLALELGSVTRETDSGPLMDTGMDGAFDNDNPLEPELPPTPTQLGLEKAPDRPRDMLSSRKSLEAFKVPSPHSGEGSDYADEAEEGISAAALEKQRARRQLEAELRNLKNDISDLANWTGKIESGADLELDKKGLHKLLTMLTEESTYINRPLPQKAPTPISSLLSTLLPFSTNIPRPKPSSPMPTNPFALKESSQSSSYLTIFAPLALNAHITRASHTDSLLETHTLQFTAPPPFPRSIYNVPVVYETNPETQTVTSVSVPTDNESKKRKVPEALRRWIDARLENPLLRLDVATLCWGINRYWETSVTRAQIWARVDQKYGRDSSTRRGKDPTSGSQDGVITLAEVRRLVPHLERSTMVVHPKSDTKLRVLLSNVLAMDDWTGEPQLQPELSVSALNTSGNSSKKIDQEAKKVFHALLPQPGAGTSQGLSGTMHIDAILRATEGALNALSSHN
ncbi:hypothetical protein N7532_009138 [Penicillium argentinense]|uniref:Uncharacterized protein n=1 Tax=Penicillium argentinense TaxID=1131581 RepID=A0A9W9EYN2_9EURO|nr:uncharacterized protein N7532_009138 [Penicillium argentinense]KAJ5090454.1 hypothetical protein N7532_009138 [Penicillium argentinense]